MKQTIMEDNESWDGDGPSSVVCSVSESLVEGSSSPISGSVVEAFSECSDNTEFSNEPISVNGEALLLPSDLCTNPHLLKSILSVENITSCIAAEDLETLFNDLPNFPTLNHEEKKKTFQKLLSGDNFAFGSNPISDFAEKLKEGKFHCDIVEIAKELKGSLKYLQKIQMKKYKVNLLAEGLKNRNLILQSRNSDPRKKKKIAHQNFSNHGPVPKSKPDAATCRTKCRYKDILQNINEEVGATSSSSSSEDSSEDEDYSSTPPQMSHTLELNFINPTLESSGSSSSLNSLQLSSPSQDSDAKFHKLMYDYRKRLRKKNIKVESGKVKSSDIGTSSQNFTVYRRSLSPIRPPPHNRYLQQMSGGQIVNTQIKEETESDEEPKEMSPAPAVSKIRVNKQRKTEQEASKEDETYKEDQRVKDEETSRRNNELLTPNLASLLRSSPAVPISSSITQNILGPKSSPLDIGLELNKSKASESSSDLQFNTMSKSINSCVQSTQLTTLSRKQDNNSALKSLLDIKLIPEDISNTTNVDSNKLTLIDHSPMLADSVSRLGKSTEDLLRHPNPSLILEEPSPHDIDPLVGFESDGSSGNLSKYLSSWGSLNNLCEVQVNSQGSHCSSSTVSTQSIGISEYFSPDSHSPLTSQKLSQDILSQSIHSQETQTPPSDLLYAQEPTVLTHSTSTNTHSNLIDSKPPSVIKTDNVGVELKRPLPHTIARSPKKKKMVSTGIETLTTLADLNRLNMMDLPIQFASSEVNAVAHIAPRTSTSTIISRVDEKHCLFSLIRDIICSNPDHRMTMEEMKTHVHVWAQSPTYQQPPYNSWESLLPTAVGFLAGEIPESQPEDFVPFIEYKISIDTYQWIGAGRDSDTNLSQLANVWKQCKNETRVSVINAAPSSSAPPPAYAEVVKNVEVDLAPPARCQTSWTVRSCTPAERQLFHMQEKDRFDNPHKAYTYRMHGYEAVVGPLRGIFSHAPSAPNGKGGRDKFKLSMNRPAYVTILALVRDAVARLPNGQGTRGDVCILLKDSQYLDPTNKDLDINTSVSGALDRLHSENDPCARFDSKRKIWIYLHRNRTEGDFQKLHLESKGVKPEKKTNRNKRPKKENVAQTPTKVTKVPKLSPAEPSHSLVVSPKDPKPTFMRKILAATPNELADIPRGSPNRPTKLGDLVPSLRTHIIKLQQENQLMKEQSKPGNSATSSNKTMVTVAQISSGEISSLTSAPLVAPCVTGVTTTASMDTQTTDTCATQTIFSNGTQTSTQLFETQMTSVQQPGIQKISGVRMSTNQIPVNLISTNQIGTQSEPLTGTQVATSQTGTQIATSISGAQVITSLSGMQLVTSLSGTQFVASSGTQVVTSGTQLVTSSGTQVVASPTSGTHLAGNQMKRILEAPQRPIPISSAQSASVMEMLKNIGHNTMGSSRVVLVKTQGGQNPVLPDGRKPIMILKQKGGEDGQSQQVYLIDDKSLTTEAGLSQLMKTNLVSTSNLMSTQQKLVQSQSQGTHSSQASSTSQTSENEGNAAQEKSTQSTQAVPQFQHFTARQGGKDIKLTPAQQQQLLEKLLFSKSHQLVKASTTGGSQNMNKVLLLKTGLVPKRGGKAEKGEDQQQQTILCHSAMDSPLLSQLVSGSNITASIGGETKTTPIAFVSTTAKTQPGTSKPETSSIISSSILTSSQSTPVVKHQVLGKLMTANFGATGAAQNQQILVQNHQAGLLKSGKNQPLMAKLVTPGQPNGGQVIKVLTTHQGQPIFGKLTPGGIISKPRVAKYTNTQGQPVYSMDGLEGTCYRMATPQPQAKQSKAQAKLVATVNSPSQTLTADQLVKQNILIKPQQTPISVQGITQTTTALHQSLAKSATSGQKSTVTVSYAHPNTLRTFPSQSSDKGTPGTEVNVNLVKSQPSVVFTTQYVQTIATSSSSSQQKIQVALSQSDSQQYQQFIQNNQIFTVSNADQLQSLGVAKQGGTQKNQVINVSQLVTDKDESGVNDESQQLKTNATLVTSGAQFVATSMPGIQRIVQQPNKYITSASAAPQLVRMVPTGSLKSLGNNPFILTNGKPQQGDPSQGTSQSTVLLQPQGLQTTNGRTVTLVQQGNGQPLFLPNFQGGTINFRTVHGMKVIPFTQNGRQPVLTRIIQPNLKTTPQASPTILNVSTDTPPNT